MDNWYREHPTGTGVVRITEPYVDPLLSANLWWLPGTDRDLVVDAGLGVVPLRPALPRLFERDPLVVLTHAHLDHVGGAHEFRERAAHTAAVSLLAGGVPAALYGADLYARLGLDPGDGPVPGLLLKSLPHPGYDPRGYRVEPVEVTRPLADGDRIELGGRTLTVLHLPGHTPGCLALLEERTGALYSGDVVYDGLLIDDLPDSDVPAYRRSMAFLAELDVSVVHPGHGRSFDGARLRELAAGYLRRT
ncbi:MBL fold metallo-hydrolase [Kitasatospora sp. MBT63]|uniref:MBL fold metallo-hydrolase n=1 Tax=Kitasatospora sp. MBT63 TaxID=1444768 RepID=UPI00053B277B|nr:MBL fold metallo-hydrolase [Kitasatospora sp. MBT63]